MFWNRGKRTILQDISDFEILFIYRNTSSFKRDERILATFVDMLLPNGGSFTGKVDKEGYIKTPVGKISFLRVKDKYESETKELKGKRTDENEE